MIVNLALKGRVNGNLCTLARMPDLIFPAKHLVKYTFAFRLFGFLHSYLG